MPCIFFILRVFFTVYVVHCFFSVLSLFVTLQEWHQACKKFFRKSTFGDWPNLEYLQKVGNPIAGNS